MFGDRYDQYKAFDIHILIEGKGYIINTRRREYPSNLTINDSIFSVYTTTFNEKPEFKTHEFYIIAEQGYQTDSVILNGENLGKEFYFGLNDSLVNSDVNLSLFFSPYVAPKMTIVEVEDSTVILNINTAITNNIDSTFNAYVVIDSQVGWIIDTQKDTAYPYVIHIDTTISYMDENLFNAYVSYDTAFLESYYLDDNPVSKGEFVNLIASYYDTTEVYNFKNDGMRWYTEDCFDSIADVTYLESVYYRRARSMEVVPFELGEYELTNTVFNDSGIFSLPTEIHIEYAYDNYPEIFKDPRGFRLMRLVE